MTLSLANTAFSAVFQKRVQGQFDNIALEDASLLLEESYLAQAETKEANVAKIVKSIVATTWLVQAPIIGSVPSTNTEMIVSGRHRILAVIEIVNNYGLNAKGKAIKRTDDNETELTNIEPFINVQTLTFANNADLVEFVQTANGSRSMPAYEKGLGATYAGNITPLMKLKLNVVEQLVTAFKASTFKYTVTHSSLLGMVTASFSAIGSKAKFITSEQSQLLVNLIVEAAETNETVIDSNIARTGYKQIVELALLEESSEIVLDAQGDELENVDDDGNGFSATVAQWFASMLSAPAKASKKTKVTDLQNQVAKLTALLAERDASTINV